jgi:hypothetical protein
MPLDGAHNIAAVVAMTARTDGPNPIDTAAPSASAGEIAVQPDDAAAPHHTHFTLEAMEAMIVANTVGITALRELMTKNLATVKELTQTVTSTSTHLDTLSTAFKDVQKTTERSYRLALSPSSTTSCACPWISTTSMDPRRSLWILPR